MCLIDRHIVRNAAGVAEKFQMPVPVNHGPIESKKVIVHLRAELVDKGIFSRLAWKLPRGLAPAGVDA